MTEEKEEQEKPLAPLEVKIMNQPKDKEIKNPTSEDTIDIFDIKVTEEEIKEMQDAQ